ncbi:hypothetical protein SmJEL517_g04660 [Synchytrium microbalum]|uniref:XPG N-terminal domain-containing protein n=1 Tax=Synchytrium microbalum TaxID=1806994 RepID=A0A507BXN7_9FUNG|nr:uncharacterized protein SmJEL517_g04660 [Synchytrium microbalum]TPX32192.1 hypothetical protein SmJEL517_g04660 [Synchytrium microbalum]
MGVRNLIPHLKRYAPSSLKEVSLSHFAHQPLAIDGTLFAYQALYTSYKRGGRDHESEEQMSDAALILRGIYYVARKLTFHNVQPLFIFDGPGTGVRSIVKAVERERRRERRKELLSAIESEEQRHDRLDHLNDLLNIMSHLSSSQLDYVTADLETAAALMTDEEATSIQPPPDKPSRPPPETAAKDIEHVKNMLEAHVDNLLKIQSADDESRPVKSAAREELALIEAIKQEGALNPEHIIHLQLLQKHHLTRQDKLRSRIAQVTPNLVKQAAHLLDLMNISHYTIEKDDYEGEMVCASLASHGLVSATLTEDTDAIVAGDGLVIQKLGRNILDKDLVTVVDPQLARDGLQLSRSQFVDLCILMGTDFSSTIEGIGPVRAFGLIQKFGSIENILKNQPKLVTGDTFLPEIARGVFTRQYVPDDNLISLAEKTRTHVKQVDDTAALRYLNEQGVMDVGYGRAEGDGGVRLEKFPGE